MRCGDCGQPVQGTDVELEAIVAGITVCEECIASMDADRDASEELTVPGYRCYFVRLMDSIRLGRPAPPAG